MDEEQSLRLPDQSKIYANIYANNIARTIHGTLFILSDPWVLLNLHVSESREQLEAYI